jgi:L-asparaginase/N4-(beta-N-acetylglucosaminyl)-L-asparaginase
MPDPIVLSTWSFGARANAAAWPHLSGGSASSLDAVEQACRACEADPQVMSVGLGGYPDQAGEVSLDASIMLSPSRCGSVCYVRRFMHPISIARLVMEKTPHTMLAGEGAERFARLHGMTPAELLTGQSRAAWRQWIAENPAVRQVNQAAYLPPANVEEQAACGNLGTADERAAHDTVGVLARDAQGRVAGACSTSGSAFKVPGRVGDSPIIGHGLYVDPRAGAAVATGLGELVMGVCGTFLAVEAMRRGASPREAAVEVLQRILHNYTLREEHQAAIITLDCQGRWSSAALRPGYHTAVRTPTRDELVEPEQVMLKGS